MRYVILVLILVLCGFLACEVLQSLEPDLPLDQPQQEEEPVVENVVEQVVEDSEKPAASVLKEFFEKKSRQPYVVEYQLTANSNGNAQSSNMLQYVESPEKMRIDLVSQGVESRTYVDGISYTACTNAQNRWHCFETRADPSQDPLQNQVEENPEQYAVSYLPDRTIVGTQTSCFAVDVDTATVEYCFTKEGIPLYIKTEGSTNGQQFVNELLAVSYSDVLEEDVFTIPAPSQKYL